ncbi:MAG TPA: FAD-dependent oxidoreductase [Anaerolineales bacterium]|jgi:NADPH-dependent 2,4-dienoyl-CoA reductase/sulfur reductase-like enzyme
MQRIAIIGTGVAGISAAETIRHNCPSADILIIGDEKYVYYSRPGLAYYLTGELNEQQLYPFAEQDFRRLNLQPIYARVNSVHPVEHSLKLHDGSTIPYDRLLIATGARAARLTTPGHDFQGVLKLDNLDDAHRLLKQARRARSAVVVGGGITALEIVEGLRARGVNTHYVLRRERYWSNVLDETESRIVEQRLKDEGVQIHYYTELAEITGQRGRVRAVRTTDARLIKCDLVAFAIGIRPRKELADTAGLKTDRGILVDERLQTSHPDIFAAGDVAQVYDPFTEKYVLDSLWGPAREQGRMAGLNMLGMNIPYHKDVAFNVTRLAGLTTTIVGTVGNGIDEDLIGIARGDSETWRQPPDAITAQHDFEVNRLRILVGKKTLLGAIVMGDQSLSRTIHQLIKERADISGIRSHLLQPSAPISDVITDFWSHWKSTATN